MKHMEEFEIPAYTCQMVCKVTCDLCGEKIEHNRFDAEKVEIRHRTGTLDPEGGSGQEIAVDMCGDCFDERLIPWLQSQGANPKIEDWDL